MNAITDYAAPAKAHLLNGMRERRWARVQRVAGGLRHVARVLVLAHIAAAWVFLIALVDAHDRRVAAAEAAQRAQHALAAHTANWKCSELPQRGRPPLYLCARIDKVAKR